MTRGTIRGAFMGILLVACAAAPALAESSRDDTEPISMANVSVTALFRAVDALPEVIWPDAPAPTSIAEFVPGAREELLGQAADSLRRPLHLRFLEARCSRGAGVALVFEEVWPPYLVRTYAFAVRGHPPASADDTWTGTLGLFSFPTDEQLARNIGPDVGVCP